MNSRARYSYGRRLQAAVGGLLLGLWLGACSSSSPVLVGPEEPVLFLAQKSQPNAVMEALFQGPVNLDQAGCFRMGDAAGPTVIWPFGSRLVREKTGLVVVDRTGDELVRIGSNARIGGGNIPDLGALDVLTEPFLEAALRRCPGSYWIVGDVLEPEPRGG